MSELPSLKMRNGADSFKASEPIMILSGRDLVGMPQNIALTQSEAEMVSRKLLEMTVGVRVSRFIRSDDAAAKREIHGKEGGSSSV